MHRLVKRASDSLLQGETGKVAEGYKGNEEWKKRGHDKRRERRENRRKPRYATSLERLPVFFFDVGLLQHFGQKVMPDVTAVRIWNGDRYGSPQHKLMSSARVRAAKPGTERKRLVPAA
jgi:hypothetical protein